MIDKELQAINLLSISNLLGIKGYKYNGNNDILNEIEDIGIFSQSIISKLRRENEISCIECGNQIALQTQNELLKLIKGDVNYEKNE